MKELSQQHARCARRRTATYNNNNNKKYGLRDIWYAINYRFIFHLNRYFFRKHWRHADESFVSRVCMCVELPGWKTMNNVCVCEMKFIVCDNLILLVSRQAKCKKERREQVIATVSHFNSSQIYLSCDVFTFFFLNSSPFHLPFISRVFYGTAIYKIVFHLMWLIAVSQVMCRRVFTVDRTPSESLSRNRVYWDRQRIKFDSEN